MNISELIKKLEELKKEHGDLPVRIQSLSHLYRPEPIFEKKNVYILLNP